MAYNPDLQRDPAAHAAAAVIRAAEHRPDKATAPDVLEAWRVLGEWVDRVNASLAA